MNDGGTVEEWLRFFDEAGLPKEFAETYAVTFSKNQMKLDMLPDITKEHLLDMGISLVGHIIGILRHAKTVHNQTVTRTTLLKCPSGSSEKKADFVSSPPTKPIAPQNECQPKLNTIVNLNGIRESAVGSDQAAKKPNTKIRLSPAKPVVPSVDVKRIRKVTPEQEGAYKIKMPSGTTSRSREILARKKLVTGESEKKPVFERLGLDTSVSSSTEISREVDTSPEWKSSSTGKPEGEGVFSRLGHRCQVSSTAEDSGAKCRQKNITVAAAAADEENDGSSSLIEDKPLPYIGILKTSMSTRKSPAAAAAAAISSLKRPLTPIRERTLHSDSLISGSHKPSMNSRLSQESVTGQNRNNVVFTIINKPDMRKTSVKERLGTVTLNKEIGRGQQNAKFEPYPTAGRGDDDRRTKGAEGKKVSFGTVSKQAIPPRAKKPSPPTRLSSFGRDTAADFMYRGSIGMGTGVFSRLGQ